MLLLVYRRAVDVQPLITHRFSLAQDFSSKTINEGFRVSAGGGDAIKVRVALGLRDVCIASVQSAFVERVCDKCGVTGCVWFLRRCVVFLVDEWSLPGGSGGVVVVMCDGLVGDPPLLDLRRRVFLVLRKDKCCRGGARHVDACSRKKTLAIRDAETISVSSPCSLPGAHSPFFQHSTPRFKHPPTQPNFVYFVLAHFCKFSPFFGLVYLAGHVRPRGRCWCQVDLIRGVSGTIVRRVTHPRGNLVFLFFQKPMMKLAFTIFSEIPALLQYSIPKRQKEVSLSRVA